jgi:hypothetical protein
VLETCTPQEERATYDRTTCPGSEKISRPITTIGHEEMALDENGLILFSKIKNVTYPAWHGKAHLNGIAFNHYFITPAHFHVSSSTDQDYYFVRNNVNVHLTFVNKNVRRDVALWSFSKKLDAAPGYFLKHLMDDDTFLKKMNKTVSAVQYIPSTDLSMLVEVNFVKDISVVLNPVGTKSYDFLWQVRCLKIIGGQTLAGDCGGVLVALDSSMERKIIGMHVIGSVRQSYASLLTTELISELMIPEPELYNEEMSFDSNICDHTVLNIDHKYPIVDTLGMINMTVPAPKDHPHGEIDYVGELDFKATPATTTGLKKHPLYGTFKPNCAPACLQTEQVEDTTNLLVNDYGQKDILLTQFAKYADVQISTETENEHLEDMITQLTEHFGDILQDEDLGESNESVCINGDLDDPNSHPLDVRTSAGLPWSNLGNRGGRKKLSYLNQTTTVDGRLIYKISDSPHGHLLRKAVKHKLDYAQRGYRTASLWKNCLKDETRPNEKVKTGATRLFTAAPFCTILAQRHFFGKFKTAWTKHSDKLFHSVGVNPHSTTWTEIYNKLRTKGAEGYDADFGRYDGRLKANFMEAAGSIVINTICNSTSNNNELAMHVMWDEIIHTLQVSNRSVFMTHHGNPSGNPMTTIVNCIVNLLYHWFAYRRITGKLSLRCFAQELGFTCFGDDVVWSTEPEMTKVTFAKIADVMINELGQDYTTASKDSADTAVSKKISELQFLKRSFKKNEGILVMSPLETDSIEQQFNWTSMPEGDVEGIRNQIEEAMIEASQHGPDYFTQFARKIESGIRKAGLNRYSAFEIPKWIYSDVRNVLLSRYDPASVGTIR